MAGEIFFEHGHNNILRFLPDRIRIENYWAKPKNFELGKTVFRRNQIIADLFTRIHFGEKLGTGFGRIREICKKENSPFPEIEFNESYFYTTFRQSQEYLNLAKGLPEKVTEKVTENQRKILEMMRKNPFVSKKKMSDGTGISIKSISQNGGLETLK